ncbi:hypothetical protein MKS88_003449 [Plasmodium brasilianum]|uniref:Uncharacterized protein n=1 Tax=Plasmodium brasilianum TaxID=5824 RepID=A0ACB9Y9K9_PLABR|nr:hypothetical protein MKS88_003449 [Plasmodium brasilianum]
MSMLKIYNKKERIRLFFFIKFFTFILLNEYVILCSGVSNLYKILDKKQNDYRKSGTIIYEALVVHKNKRCSSIEWMKEGAPNMAAYEKADISNNKKGTKGKNKKPCKSSFINKGVSEQSAEVKSHAYTEGNTYFDKGILRNKNYVEKVKENVRFGFKFLSKCIGRKVGIFNFIFILHLALAVTFIISTCLYCNEAELTDIPWIVTLVLRLLPILWIIFLLGIFYIYRKTVKNDK